MDAVRRRSPTAQGRRQQAALIACKTVIGYGAPKKAGTAATHGSPLGADEIAGAREKLGWTQRALRDPGGHPQAWRAAGARGAAAREAWEARWNKLDGRVREEFERPTAARCGGRRRRASISLREAAASDTAERATRRVVGAGARSAGRGAAGADRRFGGSHRLQQHQGEGAEADRQAATSRAAIIYYGIREHGMAAAMNGMALHGGLIPYGGTFLVFSDYCRPAIRLAALMQQQVVYVMTHDSIGLGEDGPTHQPVEHLAALRAIPNLNVFRPADGVETAECWALAVGHGGTPSVLALTRQNVPNLRKEPLGENKSARGRLRAARGGRRQRARDASLRPAPRSARGEGGGCAGGEGHRGGGRVAAVV